MRTHNGGGDISHNVQTEIEAKNHFVFAVDVVSEGVDYAQLHSIKSIGIHIFSDTRNRKCANGIGVAFLCL